MTDAVPSSSRRWLRMVWIAAGLLLLCATPVVFVAATAPSAESLPAPDTAMAIPLPDGRTVTLADVIEGDLEIARADDEEVVETVEWKGRTIPLTEERPPPKTATPYALGMYYHDVGRDDLALPLLRSVPRSDSKWATAQRHIGWKIYSRRLNQPRLGVAYINRSIAADPTEGNAWQDAYRAYARSLGLDL